MAIISNCTNSLCTHTWPTTSFWDCGEYIATACKLQVGHPPGAPTFLLLGNFSPILLLEYY